MNKLWNWLNGKKTIVGLTMLWLADRLWLKELLPDGAIEGAVVDGLIFIGGALAGIGFIHKTLKNSDNKTYTDEFKGT